jgi:hypothetical protein
MQQVMPGSREEVAKIELHTEFTRSWQRAAGIFLVTAALPHACGCWRKEAASTRPQERFRLLAAIQQLQQVRSAATFSHSCQPPARSAPSKTAWRILRGLAALTPRVGWVVKALLHGGDEQVYFGREGWLFYRASVDSVTGPGFLTEQWQRRRLRDADKSLPPPQPAPLQALLQFHHQLAERGIVLVVMPVPGKESILSEMLAPRRRAKSSESSFEAFKSQLSAAGVSSSTRAEFSPI